MKSASTTPTSSMLIRTKFYRPSLPSDLVDRPCLIDQIKRGLDRPLTLVSAPAGYGKSVLVSSWLSRCERPSAWLTLDESIDDLGVFLAYFVTAIQTIFPGALQRTQALLAAANLPPIGVLAGSLINELDELDRDFVMVLDDYHTSHRPEIHDLLNALLQPPTQHMHLVLITRKDPPLPHSVLLGGNQMNEVRLSELRFSADEIAAFMRNALESPLPGGSDCCIGGADGRLDHEPASGGGDTALQPRCEQQDCRFAGSGAQPQSDRLPAERSARADATRDRRTCAEEPRSSTGCAARCAQPCSAARHLKIMPGLPWSGWSRTTCSSYPWTASAAGIVTTISFAVSCSSGWSDGTMPAIRRSFTTWRAPGSLVRARLRRRCSTRC